MSRFVLTAQLQLQAPNNVAQVVRQIQNQLNGVTVNLQVQGAAQAQRQIQQVTQNVNQATTAAERMGRAFAVSVRRFAAFSIATRAVGLFTSTLGDAVQTAINFERQLIKVAQVTGKSVSQLRGLTDEITRLSTGLGVSSDSLLEVSTVLAQAGLSANDTKIALNALAKAALAPNFDSITETAEGAIAILAQFQEGVGALERQLGSINAVAGAFAVEAGDLIDVVRRTGGVFKSSGGSLNELLALFTSVRATTRESAESIGTGLRTIFTRIQRPKTIEFLKQFGVELVDLEGKFVGPFEAVKRLSEGLAGLGERDITFIKIAEELGGFRQIGKVLPLLQQFSTAQAALNVATKASNSLSSDAASAQAALAIRIIKVKEEFLALVRSITETSTFQAFANTALSLASALIKLAESIKPLIPLLGAMAAIKLTKGIGGFLGGVGGGLSSGRTFNKGGKVHKFARGGMVPGSGNRDTVPAMLQPGEFVIRKSSVNRLGAGNLAAMNENRFNRGTSGKGIQGLSATSLRGKLPVSPNPMATKGSKKYKGDPGSTGSFKAIFDVNPNEVGAFVLQPAKGSDGFYQASGPTPFTLPPNNRYSQFFAKSVGLSQQDLGTGVKAELSPASYPIFYPGKNDLQTSQYASVIRNATQKGLKLSLTNVANQVNRQKLLDVDPAIRSNKSLLNSAVDNVSSDQNLLSTIDGYIFEGMITALTGAKAAGGRSNFDFPASSISTNREKLRTLFGNNPLLGSLRKAEAKRNVSEVRGGVQSKIVNEIIANKKAGVKLRKMATGGVVQKFAAGGMAQAPLIDDIINASGTVMPRPSSAIAALIKAGGGAIDIDRTLKRTIGDKAYGMAKTSGQQSAALNKYFRDPNARLKDVTSAPLTVFGKELQTAIKSGQLQPGKLSIVSKSQRVPGVAEYLSKLFGIPLANMIFTQGGSKQPAMDALRAKGPRSTRVARFATGGGVGTDTVPALLTPGEFVINRTSASKIGYGNLNRMNKVGRYAKGGVVQQYATGTPMVGAQPARSSSNPNIVAFASLQALGQQAQVVSQAQQQQAQATQQNTQAQQQNRRSIVETAAANKMLVASMTVGFLQSMLPALDENASGLTRASHSLLGLVTTITSVGFALEAFNIQLKTKAIFDFIGGTKSASQTLKSLPQLKTLMGGFNRGMSGSTKQATTALGKVGQNVGSVVSKGRNAASSIGNRLGSFGSSINQSQIGRGFSAGLNSPNATFGRIANSSRGIGAKAGGFVGRSLSVGGQALSRIPGAGLIGKGLSSAASFAGSTGSQFTKGVGATLKNPAKTIIGSGASTSAQAGGFVGKGLANLNKLGGAALGVGLAFTGITSIVDSFSDYQGQANKAIQEGNIEKAKSNSVEAVGSEAVNSLGSSIIAASAIFGPFGLAAGAAAAGLLKLGSELPGVGPSIKKFAIGIGTFFGGNTLNSIETLASAQAQAVKTQKAFEQGQKDAASALEDLQNGTISASEALGKIANVQASRQATQTANEKAVEANKGNKSGAVGGFLRGTARVATLGLAGYFGLESGKQRNQRIDKENAGMIKQNAEAERKAFEISRPVVNESMKRGIAQGMSRDQIDEQLGANSPGAMRSRMSQLRIKASQADIAGNTEEANAFREQASILEEQARELDKSFENLQKEAERTQKAFDAMNLGMQDVQGAAAAASLGITNYIASQQAGNIPLQQSLAVLEASVTSAAQGISNADFDAAFSDAEATLRKFGANDEQINKFKGNLKAVNEVQKNSATLFEETKNDLKGRLSSGSADDRRKAFGNILGQNLASQKDAAGNRLYDDDTIKRLQDQIGTLSEDQINELGKGNFTVFEQVMGDLGKKVLEQVNGPLNDAIKIQEQLNQLTKNRIEAERQLMSAQQEALNVQMEARDIEAKYGGKAVTPSERRANIVAQANVQATGVSGVDNLKTGSAAEIAKRTQQIGARQQEIANIRAAAGQGDKAAQAQLAGDAGLKLEEEEKRLNEAARSQIQTTRDLIKAKEEELKTIEEKNKLEKQSMESLINGDIEKFFDQQAAVGATAAIATGNQDLMNAFGATALAGAYSDIERQKEAGVQEIYGQRIAGPGGLGESAATAALAARGVQNPAAAQMLAGTTPAEEAVKSDIRALAATMGPTADLQVSAAQYQLDAANIQLQAAQKKADEAISNTRDREMAPQVNQSAESERASRDAEAASRGREPTMFRNGGTVYANRGIFVPRGTDTVPAMLTPGEFVVRREAVNRGNNLQLLQAMNNGLSGSAGASAGVQNFARGGKVQYLAGGGLLNGIVQNILGTDVIGMLTKALTSFTSQMSDTIKSLQDTKFKITLDSTNVNVNISGNSGLLGGLTQEARNEIAKIVSDKIKNTSVGSGGKLVENTSTMPKG
jgi:TP901 family phage tail tape measure protein